MPNFFSALRVAQMQNRVGAVAWPGWFLVAADLLKFRIGYTHMLARATSLCTCHVLKIGDLLRSVNT